MGYSVDERNKVVEEYIYLIDALADSVAKIENIDVDELKSYGYEQLIYQVERYDSDFEKYAKKCIVDIVFDGIAKIKFGKSYKIYYNYLSSKQEMLQQMDSNISYINVTEVLNYMKETGKITSKYLQYLRAKLFVNKPLCIDAYKNKLIIDDELLFFNATTSIRYKSIEKALRVLDKREKYIIIFRYGLNGVKPMSQTNLAEHFNCSRTRIFSLEQRALKKLREFDIQGNLRCTLDIIEDHKEDSYKIKVRNNIY